MILTIYFYFNVAINFISIVMQLQLLLFNENFTFVLASWKFQLETELRNIAKHNGNVTFSFVIRFDVIKIGSILHFSFRAFFPYFFYCRLCASSSFSCGSHSQVLHRKCELLNHLFRFWRTFDTSKCGDLLGFLVVVIVIISNVVGSNRFIDVNIKWFHDDALVSTFLYETFLPITIRTTD